MKHRLDAAPSPARLTPVPGALADPVVGTRTPAPARLSVGVIGAGRVGAVLAHALRAAGHDVVAAAAESDASRARLADLLPGVRRAKPTSVARAVRSTDGRGGVLLLTVPDDMLPGVVRSLADAGALRPGTIVAHTSGRHGLAVLAPAAAVGARVVALHPAMTFTGTALDVDRLAGCVFGLTAGPGEREVAAALVADVGARPMWVPEESRTLYHAGLAHGANHLVTLVSEAMEILARAGVDEPAAALRPLLTAALDNALASGDAALTGPIVRGDLGTVQAHLRELAEHSPTSLPSYVALARATLGRATLDGRLVPLRAHRIAEALDAGLAVDAGTPQPSTRSVSQPPSQVASEDAR